jgi:hypothetical protein
MVKSGDLTVGRTMQLHVSPNPTYLEMLLARLSTFIFRQQPAAGRYRLPFSRIKHQVHFH